VRIVRCAVNASILLLGAPWIAQLLGSSELTDPLRVLALYFVANAIESMGFALALRHRRSPLVNYIGLGCTLVSTVFCIVYSYFARDHWGLIFAALLERLLHAVASHFIYPTMRPRFAWDRDTLREIFAFARYVLPTSMLTMALSQFERIVFLRLFDLRLMGVFGVASSVGGPVESLCMKISQVVLYARYAGTHREAPTRMREAFYAEGFKPMLLMFVLPALVGGAGQGLIDLLYDPRYAQAGFILQCFMVRALLLSYLRPREQMLTALGELAVQLHTNVLRALLIAPLVLGGFYLYGFTGFIAALAIEPLAAVLYACWRQHRLGLLDWRKDLQLALLAALLWLGAWAVSTGVFWLWRHH
jgi:lipopolysaccharide exporter